MYFKIVNIQTVRHRYAPIIPPNKAMTFFAELKLKKTEGSISNPTVKKNNASRVLRNGAELK